MAGSRISFFSPARCMSCVAKLGDCKMQQIVVYISGCLQFASLFSSIETARISTLATGATNFAFKV